MMKITGLSHLFKWENLHNWWLTKYFFAPLYMCPLFPIVLVSYCSHVHWSCGYLYVVSASVLRALYILCITGIVPCRSTRFTLALLFGYIPVFCICCGVQQVSHQGETRRGLVTDGVYITRRWLHLLDVPGLDGVSGQDKLGLIGSWWILKGWLLTSCTSPIKLPEGQHTGERLGEERTPVYLRMVPDVTGGSSVFDPHRIQQDPEPRRRYPREGLLGETYPFLLDYYFNKHLWNGANPTLCLTCVNVLTQPRGLPHDTHGFCVVDMWSWSIGLRAHT